MFPLVVCCNPTGEKVPGSLPGLRMPEHPPSSYSKPNPMRVEILLSLTNFVNFARHLSDGSQVYDFSVAGVDMDGSAGVVDVSRYMTSDQHASFLFLTTPVGRFHNPTSWEVFQGHNKSEDTSRMNASSGLAASQEQHEPQAELLRQLETIARGDPHIAHQELLRRGVPGPFVVVKRRDGTRHVVYDLRGPVDPRLRLNRRLADMDALELMMFHDFSAEKVAELQQYGEES